ncbi:MAG: sulfotransferase family 2 domain-containing protein [Pseudomonadota bacterium]
MSSIRDFGTAIRRSLEEPPSPVRKAIVRHVRSDPWRPHHDKTASLYIHIPRTAGGSIVEALYDHEERGHTPLYAYAYTRPEAMDGLFKFSVVRNPWDRMVSAYHRVLGTAKNPATRAWGERNLLRFGSFDAFIDAIGEDQTLRWTVLSYPHFRAQFEYLSVDGALAVDFVGRFETLAEDFSTIANRVRPGASLGHRHKSSHAHYRTYYTDRTAEIVGSIYARDVSAFDYSF